jgi:GAF domain-containing protein
MRQHTVEHLLKRVEELSNIGRALSSERDKNRLLEQILLGAKRLTNANAGTLYLLTEDKKLRFETLINDELKITMGGTTGVPITFDPVPLYDAEGKPNFNNVVTFSVLKDQTVNIEDAYDAAKFDFSGTRKFDAKTGYRSKSFLTVPLKNHEDEIVGVLQLLNRQDDDTHEIIYFDEQDQHLAESLASQAAVTLTNKTLIEEQKQLFEAFIQVIAKSIDEKSPYTAGHCTRVPIITMMLADATI